jgi:GNAT superfamily N-acetyltransferase
MAAYAIVIEESMTGEVLESVRRGLRQADPADVPPRDHQAMCLSLRDAGGAIVGGLYGSTMWGWLMVDGLWVNESLRGQGHGSRLLAEAEAIALRRGCRGAWLGTFDFQARDFYERHGYTVFAELADFPAGHTHFHLRKNFPAPAPPPA